MIASFRQLPAITQGILLFIGGIFLFSGQDALAKYLSEFHEPFMVVWIRYASQTFWTLIILAPWLRKYLKTKHLGLQLVRSGFLFSATFFFFSSFRHMQLAEAIAIFEIAPLLITAASVVVLKEQVGPRRWIGVGFGLIGALIIIRPGTEVFTWAALYPVGAAISFAGYSISTRFLSSDEPALTSFVYTSLIGTVVASIMVPGFWSPPATEHLPMMIGFGILGGVGHYLLILAFALAPASVLAPFSYLGLITATLFGYLVFSELPDLMTWVGAAIIVGAGLYVWYRENAAKA